VDITHALDQLLRVDGLGRHRLDAKALGFETLPVRHTGRQQDTPWAMPGAFQPAEDGEPVHRRKVLVEQDDVRVVGHHGVQDRSSVGAALQHDEFGLAAEERVQTGQGDGMIVSQDQPDSPPVPVIAVTA
jgi:hypothetical protein